MEILLERQAAYIAEHGGFRYPPLLEWFIRDGDEQFVQLPDPLEPKPKPGPRPPRRYRPAASIRAELTEVEAQMSAVASRSDIGDTAAANLSPHARSRAARTAGRRRFGQMDRDLETYTRLDQRRKRLTAQLWTAEARDHAREVG